MNQFDAGVNLADDQLDGPLLVEGPTGEGYVTVLKANGTYISVRDQIMEHARDAKMSGVLLLSKEPKHWRENLGYCDTYTHPTFSVRTTIGIHPKNVYHAFDRQNPEQIYDPNFEIMRKMARDPRVSAIGITGLDYSKNDASRQKKVLIRHVEIAVEVGKPLVFFVRGEGAHEDFMDVMTPLKRQYPELQGVIHCFTDSPEHLRDYLNLDLYIGITGWLTQNWRNHDLRRSIRQLPMDRVIFATDTPYLCPPLYKEDFDVERSQPDAIGYICARFAREKRMDYQQVAYQVLKNTQRLFQL